MKPSLRTVVRTLPILLAFFACSRLFAADKPNILWLTSEDHGPEMGCYGDPNARTPNIDALAAKGMVFKRAWSVAPVCAPARSVIISGIYTSSSGGQHMRSMVPIPDEIKLYPQLLRAAGYYCTNNSKEDYNVEKPKDLWNESSGAAHWKKRAAGQPFFAIFNSTKSHESQIRTRPHTQIADPAAMRVRAYHPDSPEVRQDWAQYYDKVSEADADAGLRLKEIEAAGLAEDTIVFYYGDHGSGMPRSKRWPSNSGLNVPMVVYFPDKFIHLAPKEYRKDLNTQAPHPPTPSPQSTGARGGKNSESVKLATNLFTSDPPNPGLMKTEPTALAADCEIPTLSETTPEASAYGSLDSSFSSAAPASLSEDGKRIADVPRFSMSERLVSFVDLAPTLLSIVGVKPPAWMQGHAFAGIHQAEAQPFIFGERGRMDERMDLVRSVTDGRYVYLRNYYPHVSQGQRVAYQFETPTTRVWRAQFDAGNTNDAQSIFWRVPKAPEELYDLQNDRDEVKNLVKSGEHRAILEKLRQAQRDHLLKIHDVCFLPEIEIHTRSKGSTPYELARDEGRYPMRRIVAAAELASNLEPSAIPELTKLVGDSDSAVRYWAVLGFLMRGQEAIAANTNVLLKALEDPAVPVRIVAAQAIGLYGNDDGRATSLKILGELAPPNKHGVLVSMSALAAIEALGDKGSSLIELVRGIDPKGDSPDERYNSYVPRLIQNITNTTEEAGTVKKKANRKEKKARAESTR